MLGIVLSGNVLMSESMSESEVYTGNVETYSKNIEENISNGTMSFIENRQCLVTLWKKTVSSSGENHLTITASCIEDQNSKINWDYPDVNRKEAVSVIYIYGNDMVESINSKLNEGKITLFFKKLAYYKADNEKYQKGEYYYYESN